MPQCNIWKVNAKHPSPDVLDKWITSFYTNTATERYVVLYGPSGNGKTYCVEQLAKEHQLDLLRYTADDMSTMNSIEKSLNLQSIGSQRKKLIVFDDIQDIKNKKRVCKLHTLSHFPIVYIISNIGKLGEDFLAGALVLQVKRPFDFQIRDILKQISEERAIDCENIYDIAEQCASVRTAIQSLYIDCPIVKDQSNNNFYAITKRMSKRVLKKDVSWFVLLHAFRNINQIDINSYNVMKKFAQLDYVVNYLHFKNKDTLLDKLIFNTLPNIELVEPQWEERQFKKKEVVEEQPVVEKVEEQTPVSSWF